MKKKCLILLSILFVILGMVTLTGCGEKNQVQNQNNRTASNTTTNTVDEEKEDEEFNSLFIYAPDKFEDCNRIVVRMGKEAVVIFPSDDDFNYIMYKQDKNYNDQSNSYFSKWRVKLSKVPGLKEFLMGTNILSKLKLEKNKEYEDAKYKIEYNITGRTVVYESKKDDTVMEEIHKLLKLDDKSIYGNYTYAVRNEGNAEKQINSLKYDMVIKDNVKNAIYYAEKIYNYELINSAKKEKYIIEVMASNPEKVTIEIDIQKAEEKDLNKATAKKEEKSLMDLVKQNWKDFYSMELSDQLDRYSD